MIKVLILIIICFLPSGALNVSSAAGHKSLSEIRERQAYRDAVGCIILGLCDYRKDWK